MIFRKKQRKYSRYKSYPPTRHMLENKHILSNILYTMLTLLLIYSVIVVFPKIIHKKARANNKPTHTDHSADYSDTVNSVSDDSNSIFTFIPLENGNMAIKIKALRTTSELFRIQKLVLPATYQGVPVTEIAENGFQKCTFLEEIVIPDTYTKIGANAFRGCKALRNISILKNITAIDDYAFSNCTSLINITLVRVNTIGIAAFENCTSLSQIHFSESLTEIGESAFRGCSALTEIVIPGSVKTVESDTFCRCTSLTKITLKNGITKLCGSCFADCELKVLYIPKSLDTIDPYAFSPKYLTHVYFEYPNGWHTKQIDSNPWTAVSDDLADPLQAAKVLKANYFQYWKRY